MPHDPLAKPDHRLLVNVKDDMDVYDLDGDKIGEVEYVQFGDESLSEPGPETVTAAGPSADWEDSLVEDIAEALAAPDRIPPELRERMWRYGFIKIDTGLLRSDRYAMADQIVGVADDRVTLNARSDELLEL